MKVLTLTLLLLALSILLCIAFQIKVHQAYFLDSSAPSYSAPTYTSISSSSPILNILNISLKESSSSSSSLSSFLEKETTAMIIPPPTCQFKNLWNRTINRIYFLHMRKAGGSSLRSYFRQVADKHGLEFKAAEGYLHPEQPGQNDTTLYITHVREPIARAISHYKYENRWDCKTQLQKHNDGFIPTLNNTVMSLSNFTITNHSISTRRLWTCASNCYARWASGRVEHVIDHDDDVEQQQLDHAARISLWKYDVIIVYEWIHQDPGGEYVKFIESMFGVGRLNRTVGMTCGRRAAAANQQVPLLVQPNDLNLLHHVNQVDMKLYQDLTSCQPKFLQHDVNRTIMHWKKMAKKRAKQLFRIQRQQQGYMDERNPAD